MREKLHKLPVEEDAPNEEDAPKGCVFGFNPAGYK